MSSGVRVETRDRCIEIILERPPANAINAALSTAIHGALSTLQQDPELRVGIIGGGDGRFFSAGWDLKEIAAMEDN